MTVHVKAYKNPGSDFVIRMVRRLSESTAGYGKLTHPSAVGPLVVNVVVDPTREKPIADMLFHRGSRDRIAFGVTTESADDLRAAGEALLLAADLLEGVHPDGRVVQ